MYSMDREETRRTNFVASDSAVVGEGEGDGDDVIVQPDNSTLSAVYYMLYSMSRTRGQGLLRLRWVAEYHQR